MGDAGAGEPLGQDARAVVQVVLVTPAAVDVDAFQRAQVRGVPRHEMDRVMALPCLPALADQFAGFEVEWQPEAQRHRRIGIVGGCHRDVHEDMPFGVGKLVSCPYVLQKALDAAVVAAVGGTLGLCRNVDDAGLARRNPILVELVQGPRPVAVIAEIKQRIAGMVSDCTPMPRVFHAMDDGAVPARRFAEAATVIAPAKSAELAIDERDQLRNQIVGVVADGR